MGNALLWFVSVLVGGGDTYAIYYECMDTACLFIDVGCVYVGFFLFFFSTCVYACLCAHIKSHPECPCDWSGATEGRESV